ncbi:MAG: SEC-C domain-containing protein [Muribaculaceae bacterium]|nr:SEC-C domain-containing protein [Muribaculaceae bacterium]
MYSRRRSLYPNISFTRNIWIKGDKCACGSGKIWENCHGKSKYRI